MRELRPTEVCGRARFPAQVHPTFLAFGPRTLSLPEAASSAPAALPQQDGSGHFPVGSHSLTWLRSEEVNRKHPGCDPQASAP